jgi:hypothetical protein
MNYKEVIDTMNENLDTNTSFVERLKYIYQAISKELTATDRKEFDNYADSILTAIELFFNGERYKAFKEIYKAYFPENKPNMKISTLHKDSVLYRMRCVNHYTQFLPEEMYHIPFELRHIVGNERYSVTGLPSLYLGSSVYGCWEETKRQNIDYSNVAIFTVSKNLKFIDLILPNDRRIIDDFRTLPLIISCQLTVLDRGGKFFPEYIIPQLIMDCLVATRNLPREQNPFICGIRYASNFQNQRDLLFSYKGHEKLFINYVIPPYKVSEKGICPTIRTLFQINGVTSYEEIKLLNIVDKKVSEAKLQYERSLFGMLESRLKFLKSKERMFTYHNLEGALTF